MPESYDNRGGKDAKHILRDRSLLWEQSVKHHSPWLFHNTRVFHYSQPYLMHLLGLIQLTARLRMHLRSLKWFRWSGAPDPLSLGTNRCLTTRGLRSFFRLVWLVSELIWLHDVCSEARPLRLCGCASHVVVIWVVGHHDASRPDDQSLEMTPRCAVYSPSTSPLALLENISCSTCQKRSEENRGERSRVQ